MDEVTSAYSKYARQGGEGKSNYKRAQSWGYDTEIPELFDAACGGGCPLRLPGAPKLGERVLDLGCGGGHDVVLASKMVGPTGKVYGIDVTEAMLDQTRKNLKWAESPVELILGPIDSKIQVPRVDVVMSNGAFNLTFDKEAAFRTAFRALNAGGRFLLCDVCEIPAVGERSGGTWAN